MALIFNTEISETEVLHAFNNSVVEFYSDSEKTSIKATIIILGEELEITPNPNGVFRYNFKEFVKKLINTNYFQDTIQPNIQTSFVYTDDTVFKDLEVNYKVQLNDLTEDVITKNYKFLKSVKQLEDYRRNETNTNNTELSVLYPSDGNKIYHTTYFEGYPFDIPIYSNIDREITIANKKTGLSTSFNLTKGVNRLFVSDGSSNFSLENKLPLYLGVNELEVKINNEVAVTIFLKKKDSECGVYLKWFNNDGGWNYFLYRYPSENRKFKSSGTVNKDYENLKDTNDLDIEMGLDSSDTIRFFAGRLDENEKNIINGLSESPKIYRYLKCMFQKSEFNNWISERIGFSSTNLTDSKKNLYQSVVTLKKAKRNTMTL
mgnify:CR=1 FL=1